MEKNFKMFSCFPDMQSVCMDHYPLVEHGFINTERSYKLSYECHAGYNMEGSEVVICSDGKWSQPPTCSAPPGEMNDITVTLEKLCEVRT